MNLRIDSRESGHLSWGTFRVLSGVQGVFTVFSGCFALSPLRVPSWDPSKPITNRSAERGLPLPLGRGVCETKSKNGRSRPRKPFVSRVFCAQRGLETMVSEGAGPRARGR